MGCVSMSPMLNIDKGYVSRYLDSFNEGHDEGVIISSQANDALPKFHH
jgi:hypothetical protein